MFGVPGSNRSGRKDGTSSVWETLPVPPLKERLNLGGEFITDQKTAGTLWTAKTFMSGESKSVQLKCLHIDWDSTGCLGSIQDKKKSMFLTEFSKFLYRHYGPTDIRSVQTDEKPGVRFKKFFCFFYKKRTVRRAWNTVKSDSMPGKLYQRTHDRIVFHRGNKYMVSGFQQSFQKNIQTGRDIGSEDYIFAFSGCEMKRAEKLFAVSKICSSTEWLT